MAGRERPSSRNAKMTAESSDVQLTHPNRVYWKDANVTKQDLADYYRGIWDWIAPHLVDRPLSLVRCPEGTTAECFFQKHASAGIDTGHLRLIADRGHKNFIAIKNLRGLMALVQVETLELHIWGTTADHLDSCNRLLFDLDPGPGVPWTDVIAGANELRQRLEDRGLVSIVKTTGGKGLHVVAPIARTGWNTARDFARQIALDLARNDPDRYTANMAKRAREHGK